MNNKGYTFVEAMISIAILSIILLAMYGILNTGNVIYTRDTNLLEMQQQTRNGMDRVVRELRQATTEQIVLDNVNTNADKIIFDRPKTPNALNPPNPANWTGIQYFLQGTNLVRQDSNGTVSNIASNISRLKFTTDASTKLITIQVQASRKIYSNLTISFSLTEIVRRRN